MVEGGLGTRDGGGSPETLRSHLDGVARYAIRGRGVHGEGGISSSASFLSSSRNPLTFRDRGSRHRSPSQCLFLVSGRALVRCSSQVSIQSARRVLVLVLVLVLVFVPNLDPRPSPPSPKLPSIAGAPNTGQIRYEFRIGICFPRRRQHRPPGPLVRRTAACPGKGFLHPPPPRGRRPGAGAGPHASAAALRPRCRFAVTDNPPSVTPARATASCPQDM